MRGNNNNKKNTHKHSIAAICVSGIFPETPTIIFLDDWCQSTATTEYEILEIFRLKFTQPNHSIIRNYALVLLRQCWLYNFKLIDIWTAISTSKHPRIYHIGYILIMAYQWNRIASAYESWRQKKTPIINKLSKRAQPRVGACDLCSHRIDSSKIIWF